MSRPVVVLWILALGAAPFSDAQEATLLLDESPAQAGEWGYRPAEGDASRVTPPAFCWRPTRGIASWELEIARDDAFSEVIYRAHDIRFNVHCPPQSIPGDHYSWRYRGVDGKGRKTRWSQTRWCGVAEDAASMPLPDRDTLLARIPKEHPRLFLRPEHLARLREAARTPQARPLWNALVKQAGKLLGDPPPSDEPPKYPAGTRSGSEAWRKIWWGNRTCTIRALGAAATLGFVWRMTGEEKYASAGKRILLACAGWDPRGSTGYRYNDEAGMPYAYHFSRAYTFLHDRLEPDDREACRRVMTVRGREMYRHLCPRHLWRPYASHSNRAWHFLGEVGIAFHGEIPEADDWVWFAANVFTCVYPVWADDDGGWHEGSAYWASYLQRFTWWADVMRAALDIDAYRKPFFAQAGYYPLYLMPPGKLGGGFGDLTARRRAEQNAPLMTALAAQARNPHWRWYVERIGGPKHEPGYIGFLRAMQPDPVAAAPPDDLPNSRVFGGTGQAVFNTSLTDANDSVQVVFKASRFGTQSHGYEANNSFLLWAYGRRLLIRSGRRDMYGSAHHRGWMWSTRSVNCITVNGRGQMRRSARAQGGILGYQISPTMDVVAGEAGGAYRGEGKDADTPILGTFMRTLVFAKPDVLIVHDRLTARNPSTFTYWLHAVNRIEVKPGNRLQIRNGDVLCDARLYATEPLAWHQTDQYDPNPRPRIKLREWHLAGSTTKPSRTAEFLALFRVRRETDDPVAEGEAIRTENGVAIHARTRGGDVTALFARPDGIGPLRAFGLEIGSGSFFRMRDQSGTDLNRLEFDCRR